MSAIAVEVEEMLNRCIRLAAAGHDPEQLLVLRPDVAEEVRPLLAMALRGLCDLFRRWGAHDLPMPGNGWDADNGDGARFHHPRPRVCLGEDGGVEICILLTPEGKNGP